MEEKPEQPEATRQLRQDPHSALLRTFHEKPPTLTLVLGNNTIFLVIR